jgi:hypothetical protein
MKVLMSSLSSVDFVSPAVTSCVVAIVAHVFVSKARM